MVLGSNTKLEERFDKRVFDGRLQTLARRLVPRFDRFLL